MSAGTGEDPVHLLQLWIMPRRKGLPPRWEQRQFAPADRAGKLVPVVSGGQWPETLVIDQDAAMYISALRARQEVVHKSRAGRKAYLFVMSGSLTVNGTPLGAGDQARIPDEPELTLRATGEAELTLLDLP